MVTEKRIKSGDIVEVETVTNKFGFKFKVSEKRVIKCKKCFKEFYPERRKHDLCPECFNETEIKRS